MKPLFILCMIVSLRPDGYAAGLVVPNDKALVEGNPNGFPFTESSSVHYQQVYDASQFALLGTYGGTIHAIGFRYNGDYNTAPLTYYSMQVRLSTTARAVDNLSATFQDNMGSDSTVVFSGNFTLGVTPPPSDNQVHPWPFPMKIPFATPFQYNPTNGNLLLDIEWTSAWLYPGNGPPWIDAVWEEADSVSRVFAYDFRRTYIPTNGTPATAGLVTLFGIAPALPPALQLSNPKLVGTNILFACSRGAPGTVASVLTTTNLGAPWTNWYAVGTNTFDVSGNCVVTNAINADCPNQFYIMELQ